MGMNVFACMHYAQHTHAGREGPSDSLELVLQMAVICSVGVRNQT